ncbi:probable ATP-dependent RNA helicase DDX5 [Dermacentor silvarum]|uniref:probable ATP-dependent RNA helicase DDX5 n=1 Tax=Dermacentor silvarum TaxID=543639 RepID=UPI001899E63D|nr:probable ATP-dependent RNA helicase DDX5 [Dermacentor silvarum]
MPIIWDLMPSFDKEKGDYRYNKIRRRRNGAEYYWESKFGWLLRKLDRMNIQLQPFEKKLYEEHPATTNRSSAEVAAYRRANGISVKLSDVPKPILAFEESNFPDFIVQSIEARRDCTSPTCIEAHCWPIALTCRNFLGIAETGSHKTLAYVLPAVIHVSRQPPLQHADGPIAVVLAPTRELAKQIHLVCSELGERAGVRSVCASNGEPKEDQYDELRKGCHICVATPRRLIEFLEEGKVNLRRCTYLVLDEVDRMLAMGFKPHVLKITELCRPDHQTIMWVTSWQSELKPFVEDLLDDYVEVKFGTVQLPAQNGVEMTVDVCQEEEKDGKLAELLDEVLKEKSKKAVVFTDTGRKADEIAWKLRLRGWSAIGLHGKKTKE